MLAEQIKKHRKAAGLTQSQFAESFHVANGTVGMWETGKREPNSRTLMRLANFFGISVDDLLNGESGTECGVAGMARVPVYGALRNDASGEIVGYEDFPLERERGDDYFGLRVADGAMYPEYLAGDIVIVRRQDSVQSGEDAVVSVGEEAAAVRRILREPEGLLVLALNAARFAPAYYSEQQIRALPVRILGVCVEMRRKKDRPAEPVRRDDP